MQRFEPGTLVLIVELLSGTAIVYAFLAHNSVTGTKAAIVEFLVEIMKDSSLK